jgi:shikimate dehydrogenase
MYHLDKLTPAAEAIGAVNTIIVAASGAGTAGSSQQKVEPDGCLLGDNTDAAGFVADLRSHGVDPAGTAAIVLGAGGSARAVAYGLAEAGAASITITNRTQSRATELAAALQARFPACQVRVSLPEELAGTVATARLIVNCTSIGMTPNVDTTPWPDSLPFRPGQTVYDLVYNPPQTRLLAQASAGGARAIGGIGMLIWQGAIAFQRWTGIEPPVEVMANAVARALAQRNLTADL